MCDCNNPSVSNVVNNELFDYLDNLQLPIIDSVHSNESYNTKSNNWREIINEYEKRILSCQRVCQGISKVLYDIEYCGVFIKSFDTNRDICEEHGILEDDFLKYHFDVFCHKVSALKDLYFKLINEIYILKLGNDIGDIAWKDLNRNRIIADAPFLTHVKEYYDYLRKIIKQRNKSSHEGIISDYHLDQIKYDLLLKRLKTENSSLTKDYDYRNDDFVKSNITKFMNNFDIHYFNVFAISRCILCSISVGIVSLTTPFIKEKYEKHILRVVIKHPNGICSRILKRLDDC